MNNKGDLKEKRYHFMSSSPFPPYPDHWKRDLAMKEVQAGHTMICRSIILICFQLIKINTL